MARGRQAVARGYVLAMTIGAVVLAIAIVVVIALWPRLPARTLPKPYDAGSARSR